MSHRYVLSFLLGCGAFVASSTAWAAPVVTSVLPADTSTVQDSVEVTADVTSAFVVTSVTANVGGVSAPMTNVAGTKWSATLNIAGVALGSASFTVTANDAGGETTTVTRSLKHDHPPTIAIQTPNYSIANPTLRLQATCTDTDAYPCASITTSYASTNSAVLDQTVSMAAAQGQTFTVSFVATDTAGLTATSSIIVSVASMDPSLVYAAPIRALDLDSTRFLFVDAAGVESMDRVSGVVTLLGPGDPTAGHLISNGATWSGGGKYVGAAEPGKRPPCCGSVCDVNGDWRASSSSANLKVTVTREHLPTGTLTMFTVAGSTSDQDRSDVDSAGNVAQGLYENGGGWKIYVLPTAGSAYLKVPMTDTGPVIDGDNVISRTHSLSAGRTPIHLTTSAGTTSLDTTSHPYTSYTDRPWPRVDYRANDGWIAYTKYVSDSRTAWTRSPAGVEALASPYVGVASVYCLNNLGDVVYNLASGARYIGAAGALNPKPSLAVSADGELRWIAEEGAWYRLYGRNVFRVGTPAGAGDAGAGDAGSPTDGGIDGAAGVDAGAPGGVDGSSESGGGDAGGAPGGGDDGAGCSVSTGSAPFGGALVAAAIATAIARARRRKR